MKTIPTFSCITLLGLTFNMPIYATSPAYFKPPHTFLGMGCKPGSISTVGKNTDKLRILLDNYAAGKYSSSGRLRTACNFTVPIHVARGYKASLIMVNWQGYIEGKGQVKRKYFVADKLDRKWIKSNFNKPDGSDFLITDKLHPGSISQCGHDFVLRIHNQIKTISANAFIAMDTVDIKAASVSLHLKWEKC